MDLDKTYFKHSICLIAMFLIGNLIIVFPQGNGAEQTVLSILLCFVISLALTTLLVQFSRCNVLSLKVSNNFALNNTFRVFFLIFALISLFVTANDYVLLIDKIRLPNTSAVVLSAIFILLALYLAKQKKKIIYVISLFAFLITAISFVVIFIFSIPNINFELFKQNITFNLKSLTSQTVFLFAHGIGQIIIAAVFIGKIPEKLKSKKTYILGYTLGLGFLFICVLNVILVLGTDLIARVPYPYSSVTSIITLGNSFSRMDGITYFIYFISSLIKASVILKVIIKVSNKISKKFGKILIYSTVITSILVAASEIFNSFSQNVYVSVALLFFEITIFTTLYIATLKRNVKS